MGAQMDVSAAKDAILHVTSTVKGRWVMVIRAGSGCGKSWLAHSLVHVRATGNDAQVKTTTFGYQGLVDRLAASTDAHVMFVDDYSRNRATPIDLVKWLTEQHKHWPNSKLRGIIVLTCNEKNMTQRFPEAIVQPERVLTLRPYTIGETQQHVQQHMPFVSEYKSSFVNEFSWNLFVNKLIAKRQYRWSHLHAAIALVPIFQCVYNHNQKLDEESFDAFWRQMMGGHDAVSTSDGQDQKQAFDPLLMLAHGILFVLVIVLHQHFVHHEDEIKDDVNQQTATLPSCLAKKRKSHTKRFEMTRKWLYTTCQYNEYKIIATSTSPKALDHAIARLVDVNVLRFVDSHKIVFEVVDPQDVVRRLHALQFAKQIGFLPFFKKVVELANIEPWLSSSGETPC